jgi:hypothetical protein
MVSIDIDLDASTVQAQLVGLKAQLESLEDDFDFDLDLDGDLGDTLDDLGDSLDNLTDGLTDDLNESLDRIDNMDPVIVEQVSGGGDSGGDTGSDSGDRHDENGFGLFNRKPSWKQLQEASKTKPRDTDGSLASAIDRIREKVPGGYATKETNVDSASVRRDRIRSKLGSKLGGGGYSMEYGGFIPDSNKWDVGTDGKRSGVLNKLDGAGDKITDSFRKAIPNMQMWWNIIGALLPALGAFAVQAAGVAAAMGSVAVAGGAVLGLGLIGHGDSMSEAFGNAKETLSELKTELFQTMQPTAQLFAPITDRFFDKVPGQVDKIADSMEGLTAYEGILNSMLEGGADVIARFFNILVRNEDIISDMASKFGAVLGDTLLNLFEWLLQTGYENMDMLMRLGRSLGMIAVTLFNVFMLVGRATAMLVPFFEILAGVSELLNNSFFSGIFAIIAGIFILTTAVSGLFSAFLSIGTLMMGVTIPIFSTLFTMIQGVTMNILLATSATYAFAQAIATAVAAATMLAGIGLVAWTGLQAAKGMKNANKIANQAGAAGSMPGGGGRGNGGGTTNNYNYRIDVGGDPDNSQIEGFADIVHETNSTESSRLPPSLSD